MKCQTFRVFCWEVDSGVESLKGVEVVFGEFIEGSGMGGVGFGELMVEGVFVGVDWVRKQLLLASQTSRMSPF